MGAPYATQVLCVHYRLIGMIMFVTLRLKHYCTVLPVVGMGVELGVLRKGMTQAGDVRGSSAGEIIWAKE
jgi:hypothetical protein